MFARSLLKGSLLTVLAMAVPPGLGAAQRQQSAGAISGVVTDEHTGRGIGGAIVHAVGVKGSTEVSATNTDSAGRFVFTRIEPGSYVLTAIRSGYSEGGLARLNSFDSLGSGTPLIVLPGEWLSDIKIHLHPLGGIGGRVSVPNGEPIPGATVRMLKQVGIGGNLELAAGQAVTTDEVGRYRFEGLASGRYFVLLPRPESDRPQSDGVGISSDERPAAVPALTYYPGVREFGAAVGIDLEEGSVRTDVDFSRIATRGYRISGTVTGSEVAGTDVLVRLLPLADNAPDGLGFEEAATVASSDGQFAMVNVPPGDYLLSATTFIREFMLFGTQIGGSIASSRFPFKNTQITPVANSSGALQLVRRNSAAGVDLTAATQVSVRGDTPDIFLTLQRSAELRGKILYDGSGHGPVKISLEPITSRASLAASPCDCQKDSFSISVPGGADYRVSIDGGRSLAIKSVTSGGLDVTSVPLHVNAAQQVGDLIVTMTDKAASLSGVLRSRDSQPIQEAVVLVFPSDPALWRNTGFSSAQLRSVALFRDTTYRINGLPAGDYHVVAVEASVLSKWQDPEFLAQAAMVARSVTLSWGQAVRLDLELSGLGVR